MKRNEKIKNQNPGIFYKIILSMLSGVCCFGFHVKVKPNPI